MVDTGHKDVTERRAVAYARVGMKAETKRLLRAGDIGKGDAFAVARIAGIAAAKETPRLIPLCHTINLTSVQVDFSWASDTSDEGRAGLEIRTTARASDRTGVEMEALTAASIAALTVYDMCKGVDDGLQVETIELLEKTGGRTPLRREPGQIGNEGG